LPCGAEQKVFAQRRKSQNSSPVDNKELRRVSKAIDTESGDDAIVIECIPGEPPTPKDESLCSSAGLHLQFYWHKSGVWVDLINDGITNEKHPLAICAAIRFGPHLLSKPVRSAVLFYSSYRKEGKVTYLGMEYLARFYEGAREAIECNSYVELVYACYAMCLFEMASKRMFSEEFQMHAKGFLISYQHLVGTGALTVEETKFMKIGYDMITQATEVTNPQWYESGRWLAFSKTCIQRLESAASRVLVSDKAPNVWKVRRVWIPKSHHLGGAVETVYQLCTLFERLAIIRRNDTWTETAIAIEDCLIALWKFISEPAIIDDDSVRIKHDIPAIPGDKYLRQLLALYYIFRLQYLFLAGRWSHAMWVEVLEVSTAICRFYPPHYDSMYPGSEVQFIIHRGVIFAGILVVHALYNPGIVIKYQNSSVVNRIIREKLADALCLTPQMIGYMSPQV
jgi:hypothetical protein